jgi:hypothetical protein
MARLMWDVLPADKWGKQYRGLMGSVAMVVLPNAEMAVTLEQLQAEALLRAKSSSDSIVVEPDPWRGGFRPLDRQTG